MFCRESKSKYSPKNMKKDENTLIITFEKGLKKEKLEKF